MLKKIFFTGILLVWVSVSIAKPVSLPNYLHSNGDKPLVEKLAADKDFIKYYISNVEFANKVIETKSGILFHKFLEKTITKDEEELLLNQLGLRSKKEFNDMALDLKTAATTFLNKFTELNQMPEQAKKELLVNAFKKVETNKEISIKFISAKNPSAIECFWWWVSCATACAITCSSASAYSECYWICEGICGGLYGVCWLQAE